MVESRETQSRNNYFSAYALSRGMTSVEDKADRMSYAVKEIFLTLQGEGAHTGRATVFALDLNHPRRLLIRQAEALFGLFPPG